MAPKTFTQHDVRLMAAAFQSLKSPPEIDYNKFAEKAGYKNAATARACFADTKKKLFANDGDGGEDAATRAAPKKRAPVKSNKRKHATPEDSSPTLAGSTPPPPTPEIQTPTNKKIKSSSSTTTTSKRNTKVKKSVGPGTPETDKDRINAKAIAAGRARYAADKLAAEIKVEHPDDGDDEEEGFDEDNVGMNVDSGEDEGSTAYELVKNEVSD